MLASGALDRALRECPLGDPALLLQQINYSIKRSLGQEQADGKSDDGLEMAIVRVNPDIQRVVFSGARFSLFHTSADTTREIKGDKSGLGYRNVATAQTFTNHEMPYEASDRFYISSDGLIDQIGGERRRAFGKQRFVEMIESIRDQPCDAQRGMILKTISKFQGDESRRDDICIIGFRIGDTGLARMVHQPPRT